MKQFLTLWMFLASLSLSTVPTTEGTLTLAAITIPTITFTSGTATTLAALGLIKLKAAALLSLTRNRRQATPSQEETNLIGVQQEILWTAVSKMEDNHKCVRRFLCEVGTGKLAAQDYTPVIKELLSTSLETSVDSTKEPYARAAKRGASHHNIAKCQADYICRETGEEIYKKTEPLRSLRKK